MRARSLRLSGDARIILRDTGLLVFGVGLMCLVSLVIPLVFHEGYAIMPLLVSAVVSFGLSACLYLPFRHSGECRLKHAMITAALGWALSMALGALPFFLTALFAQGTPTETQDLIYFRDMASAVFESVSGFSTCGLTMSPRPLDLPHTLQWWRSFTQWVGGLGFIVLILSFIAVTGATGLSLYSAEREERIHPSVISTARTLWWIYLLYTAAGMIALWSAGMPIWDAINNAMTALATGGFALTPNSIADYANVAVELVLCLLMLIGATNYTVHYKLLRGRGKAPWQDDQTRWLLLLNCFWIVSLFLTNLPAMSVTRAARVSFFQGISAGTTTGFQTTGLRGWSDTAKVLLTCAMFVGAAVGSTGGGIKVLRAMLLMRGLGWQLRRLFASPNVRVPFRLGEKYLNDGEALRRIEGAALVIFLWAAFIGAGVLVLLQSTPKEFSLADIIFEVTSAQSNVGLSVGITGPTMSTWAKLMLSLNMWAGRIEIIPALMLLRALFKGLD